MSGGVVFEKNASQFFLMAAVAAAVSTLWLGEALLDALVGALGGVLAGVDDEPPPVLLHAAIPSIAATARTSVRITTPSPGHRQRVNVASRSVRAIVKFGYTQISAAMRDGASRRHRPQRSRGAMRESVERLLRRAAGAPLGWVIAAAGIVLLVVGWYGVSGESLVARQLPYLASATIPGGALLIAGLLLAGRQRPSDRDRQMIANLHAALLEAVPPDGISVEDADALWATAKGSTYHRNGCPLARYGAQPIASDERRRRGLRPCPVCDPPADA